MKVEAIQEQQHVADEGEGQPREATFLLVLQLRPAACASDFTTFALGTPVSFL